MTFSTDDFAIRKMTQLVREGKTFTATRLANGWEITVGCWCGCGLPVAPGRQWVASHDASFAQKLARRDRDVARAEGRKLPGSFAFVYEYLAGWKRERGQ